MDSQYYGQTIQQQIQPPQKLMTPTNFKNYMFKHHRYASQHNPLGQSIQQPNVFESQIIQSQDQDQTLVNNSIIGNNNTMLRTKSQKIEQYHFTASNLRTICDNDFISGKTKMHSSQKFGLRKASRKLVPIQQNQVLKELHRKKPRRKQENIDQRTYYKMISDQYNQDLVITISSFKVKLLSQSQEENGIEEGLVCECSVNFSDAEYLVQHSFNKINQFFLDYVVLENEDQIFLEFQKFSHIPALKEDDSDLDQFADYKYPDNLQKEIETDNDSKTIVLQFPQISFYSQEQDHTQTYTLGQNDLRDIFNSNFNVMHSLISKYFSYDKLHQQIQINNGENQQQIGHLELDQEIQTFSAESQDGLFKLQEFFDQNTEYITLISMPEIFNYEQSIEELKNLHNLYQQFKEKNVKICILSGNNLEQHLQSLKSLKENHDVDNFQIQLINDQDREISQKWGMFQENSEKNEEGNYKIGKCVYIINKNKILKYKQCQYEQNQEVRDFKELIGIIENLSEQ